MKAQVISDETHCCGRAVMVGAPGVAAPGTTASEAGMDEDASPGSHIYERLGFLIIEGRSPAVTAKGRREGIHCSAAAVSRLLRHQCTDDSDACSRAQSYRKDMTAMWRNGIPLCIEALLCVPCELDESDGDASCKRGGPTVCTCHLCSDAEDGVRFGSSYVLLEQWTVAVQQLDRRSGVMPTSGCAAASAQSPVALGDLMQAVKSHLFFSQLSAWLQTSGGRRPRHVLYRLTAPGEWFRHSFMTEPVSHSFPAAAIGRRHVVKVSLASLARMDRTSNEICAEVRRLAQQPLVDSRGQPWRRCSAEGQLRSCDATSEAKETVRPESIFVKRQHRSSSNASSAITTVTTAGVAPVGNVLNCADVSQWSVAGSALSMATKGPSQQAASSSAATLEHMGAFGDSGPRSLSELKLIGCVVGAPAQAMLAFPAGSRRYPDHGGHREWNCETSYCENSRAAPPKSPKVLFSSWIKPLQMSPSVRGSSLAARATGPDGDRDIVLERERCRQRLTFEDEADDGGIDDKNSNAVTDSIRAASAANDQRSRTDESANELELSFDSSKSSLGSHVVAAATGTGLAGCCTQGQRPRRQPVFSLGSLASTSPPKLRADEAEPDLDGLPRDGVAAERATPAEAARMRRSFESFPRFSKFRLNNKQAFPSRSSPAPVKKFDRRGFHFDAELAAGGAKAIKSALSCGSLASHCLGGRTSEPRRSESSGSLSTSAPAAASSASAANACTPSSALLGNFEETLLNGRIEPAGLVEGFSVDLGASGSFCPQHVQLPVKAYFFGSLSDDNAPSPYLGYVDLQSLGKRGYLVPRKGTLQVTLFNPNRKVVKMFVVLYDLEDMPARSQTFLRQRTVYAPTGVGRVAATSRGSMREEQQDAAALPTYLRYLIHMRFATSKSSRLYLHTDLRLIFARDKFEFDSRVAASYEMRSYTEAPSNPKFSPLS